MRELTFRSVLLGIILGIVLSSANAYLGLKAGMTVAAAIPAAVISMLILTKLLRNGTILENNMVQTMASVAQAVAAGVIFTIPSFFILYYTGVISFMPSYWLIFILTFIGSLWGVVFMIIFRKPHIVDEHDVLPYPEGTACAEVLKTGQKATENAKFLLWGFTIAAILKVFQSIKVKIGDKVYKMLEEIFYFSANLKNLPIALQKFTLSVELLPALFGVGMIVGARIGIMVASGALLAWWVIIPIIGIFQPEMSAQQIYKGYVRYIGIGVIVTGALFSFFQFFPVILRVIKGHLVTVEYRKDPHQGLWYDNPNYTKDMPYPIALTLVFIGSIIFFFINPVESLLGKLLSFLVLLIFTILFTAVSSYIVGMVGSSNQPVSAMTISTLLAVALTLKFIGMYGEKGIIAVLVISVVACISLAIAGDMSQDLKTGFLVKATPYNQQIVGIISAITSSFFLSYLIFVLNDVYGFVGNNPLPAPQANLIATLAQSIFQGDVKWNEIFVGMFLGLIARLLGFSILAFGVGVYLPLGLSIPILLGGWFSNLLKDNEEKKVLIGSGLIAGDTIVGIVFVFLIATNIIPAASDKDIPIFGGFSSFLSLIVFILMIFVVYGIIRSNKGAS
ncbi:MAG: oligopeptide transporter, OPT family [Candidatus Calescibacterium sp.]|nr:oligopeptide transporter, OPT family [Candidatus Calescibacterium sp.]MCX7971652.1 oligopeptide transporter, OPT family [bacterium]MDW8195258.1 oligopeptide transporter, OPT family [Candidatus Calescibacterium sp.]